MLQGVYVKGFPLAPECGGAADFVGVGELYNFYRPGGSRSFYLAWPVLGWRTLIQVACVCQSWHWERLCVGMVEVDRSSP